MDTATDSLAGIESGSPIVGTVKDSLEDIPAGTVSDIGRMAVGIRSVSGAAWVGGIDTTRTLAAGT